MKGQLYDELSDGIYEIETKHIPDIAAALAVEVMGNNPVWKGSGVSQQQLNEYLQLEVADNLKIQEVVRQLTGRNVVLNMFFVANRRLMGCMMHKRLKEYLEQDNQHEQSASIPILKVLSKAGKQLWHDFKQEWDPMSTLYGTWGCRVVDSTVSFKVSSMRAAIVTAQAYNILRWQGFIKMLGRSSTPVGVKIYAKLGGKASCETSFEYENRSYPLFLITLNTEEERVQNALQMASSITYDQLYELSS